MIRDLLHVASTAKRKPRPHVDHDYRRQWEGHQVIRAAVGDDAYVTGRGIGEGDRILLPDGPYRARDVHGHAHSDLYLVRLEPEW